MNKVKSYKQKLVTWLAVGGLICALYVILGAFGAHGLEDKLTAKDLDTYHTGLRYMIIHGLGLILVNLVFYSLHKYNKWVNWLMVTGLVLFSLSLLIHSTQSLYSLDVNVFAMLAPIGGLSFVFSWILFTRTLTK
jgi:uncharacterized membrane protein YgdD (TMEM256/DUF423 family)